MAEDAELTLVLTKPLIWPGCAKEEGDLKYKTPCLESFMVVSGFFASSQLVCIRKKDVMVWHGE